jgi:outer membrane protein TolC
VTRFISVLLIALFFSGFLFAQQTDWDAVVQPIDAKSRDFSEYLVQLAWMNNPAGAISQDQVKNAEGALKNTKKEWMRDVQATFNLNEANLVGGGGSDSASNIFFPRYNFGINFNLYNILTQKGKNDIGKRDVKMAGHRVNQSKLELRAETLTRYASMRLSKEILKTRTLVEQEMYANFVLIKQLYNNDEKSLEDYTTATSAYYNAQEARIRAETDLLLAKLRLEEVIGVKWEKVQHPAKEE